jgi:hypothetical protein
VHEDRKGNNNDANSATKSSSSSSSAVGEGGEEEQQHIPNASEEIKDEMSKYEAKIMSGRVPQVGDSTRSDE